MSSGYGGRYVVVSPEEARRRALAAAHARLEAARRRAAVLQARHRQLADRHVLAPLPSLPVEPLAASASVDAVEQEATRISSACDHFDAALDAAVLGARRTEVQQALHEATAGLTVRLPELRPVPPAVDAPSRRPLTDGVDASLQRIAPGADRRAVERLRRRATTVLAEADPRRARVLLAILGDEVDRTNAEVTARARRARQLDDLALQLAEWSGVAVARASELLERARADSNVPVGRVEETVHAVVEHARRAADREFVAHTTLSCLRRLGYEVEAGFETIIAEEGSALARHTDWDHHAVRVQVDPDHEEVFFDVVRRADDPAAPSGAAVTPAHDLEAENAWCATLPALEEEYREAGVSLDVRIQVPPGQRVLPTVAPARFPFGAGAERTRRSRTTERERHR